MTWVKLKQVMSLLCVRKTTVTLESRPYSVPTTLKILVAEVRAVQSQATLCAAVQSPRTLCGGVNFDHAERDVNTLHGRYKGDVGSTCDDVGTMYGRCVQAITGNFEIIGVFRSDHTARWQLFQKLYKHCGIDVWCERDLMCFSNVWLE